MHCYRAINDGWGANTFHSRCDKKGETITLVKVGKYIFGGYTNVEWRKHYFLNYFFKLAIKRIGSKCELYYKQFMLKVNNLWLCTFSYFCCYELFAKLCAVVNEMFIISILVERLMNKSLGKQLITKSNCAGRQRFVASPVPSLGQLRNVKTILWYRKKLIKCKIAF